MELTVVPGAHIKQLEKKCKEQDKQLDQLQEECAELIQACAKLKKYKTASYLEDLKMEIAHVLISSELIAASYGINTNDIIEEVMKKALADGFDTADYMKVKPTCVADKVQAFLKTYSGIEITHDIMISSQYWEDRTIHCVYHGLEAIKTITYEDLRDTTWEEVWDSFFYDMIRIFYLDKSKWDQALKEGI